MFFFFSHLHAMLLHIDKAVTNLIVPKSYAIPDDNASDPVDIDEESPFRSIVTQSLAEMMPYYPSMGDHKKDHIQSVFSQLDEDEDDWVTDPCVGVPLPRSMYIVDKDWSGMAFSMSKCNT